MGALAKVSRSAAVAAPSDPASTTRQLDARLEDLGIRRVTGGLVARDDADLDAGRAVVAAALQPATPPEIVKWLAGLRSVTRHRSESDADVQLALQIMVPRLAAWPSDVVRHVCLWERWEWFPSLAELEERCDELVAGRKHLAWDLEHNVRREGDLAREREEARRRWEEAEEAQRAREADRPRFQAAIDKIFEDYRIHVRRAMPPGDV